MTSIDPFAHRAKALEAAASPQFAMAGIVHAIVYLGDQLARLVDLATAVASQPAEDTTPDEPTAGIDGLEVAALDAMPIGATVEDADGDVWTCTEGGWHLPKWASGFGEALTLSSTKLLREYGPITPR